MKPEPPVIDLAFDLDHPPEKVWRALTTPELLAVWLAPNDMTPTAGARFTVRPEGQAPVACEVIEIDARRRRLSLAWAVDAADATTVRFELAETATGTALRVCHSGFGAAVSAALPPAQPPRLRVVGRAASLRSPSRAPSRTTRLQWAA